MDLEGSVASEKRIVNPLFAKWLSSNPIDLFKSFAVDPLNAALRVLLKKREEDKKEVEKKVSLNMKEVALPYVEKLKEISSHAYA